MGSGSFRNPTHFALHTFDALPLCASFDTAALRSCLYTLVVPLLDVLDDEDMPNAGIPP